MGSKYTTQSSSGYNSSPPPDDGSQVAANLITWAAQKTKLADPVKNLADAINTALVSAFDYSVRQITASDSTVAGDHMRCVEIAPTVTVAVTVSLGDAATMTNTYRVFVKNSSAIPQTIGRVTIGDTIDGTAANITIAPGAGLGFQVINAATGYVVLDPASKLNVQGADVASAATVNLDSATGDYVHITGTTTITAITLAQGRERTVEFTGALTLTNGASLILPGGANITTAAGDTAIFRGEASSVVRCISYVPASGVFVGNKTANTVLAGPSSGAAAAPTFRALVGAEASLVLIATASASNSATIDFTTGITSTYDKYVIEVTDLIPATDNSALWLRISQDGGSTFKAGVADYAHNKVGASDTNAPSTTGSTADTRIDIATNLANSTTRTFSTTISFAGAAGTAKVKMFKWHASYVPATAVANTIINISGGGFYGTDANAINAVRLLMSSGNITSGTFALYGIRKA